MQLHQHIIKIQSVKLCYVAKSVKLYEMIIIRPQIKLK